MHDEALSMLMKMTEKKFHHDKRRDRYIVW